MATNFKRTFGNATSPLALSYLDDNFSQLEAAGTSTVTLSGAQLIGFMQSGSGATSRTVQGKLQDTVCVFDFMTASEIASVQAYSYPDVATAVQNAWNTGKNVYMPYGGYGASAKLTLSGSANHGQRIFGDGPSTTLGVGSKSTIIKPTSAVSVGIEIDGSPHIQHWELDGFTVDMDSMTDASTRIAINQKRAWGALHKRVTVINDGSNKRAWKFEAGAYTTTMMNCRGAVIQLAGTSLSDAVTTLTLLNCDFEQVAAQYCVGINVYGGSAQGSRNKFDLADINGFSVMGLDVEGTGTYLVIGSTVNHLHSAFNEFSGFSGTYSSGTPGDSILWDYFSGTLESKDNDFKISGGILSVVKANAALLRCLIENTNASAQQVDLQIKSAAGSSFFGMNSSGDTTIDCRGTTADFEVQDNGSLRLGVVSDKLALGTTTAATATNGTGEAMPANVEGYIVVTIGVTDYKIPYVKN